MSKIFLIGDTSSNGWFSIVMLVFGGVYGLRFILPYFAYISGLPFICSPKKHTVGIIYETSIGLSKSRLKIPFKMVPF